MPTGDPPMDYTLGTFTFTPNRKAWKCPECKAVNAPHVDQCSCSPAQSAGPVYPYIPAPLGPQIDPHAPWAPPYQIWCGSSTSTDLRVTLGEGTSE